MGADDIYPRAENIRVINDPPREWGPRKPFQRWEYVIGALVALLIASIVAINILGD